MAYPKEPVRRTNPWSMLPSADEEVVRRFAEAMGVGPAASGVSGVSGGSGPRQALQEMVAEDEAMSGPTGVSGPSGLPPHFAAKVEAIRGMARPAQLAGSATPQAKGSGGTSEEDVATRTDYSGNVVEHKPIDPTTFQGMINAFAETPYFRKQQEGLQQMEDLLQIGASAPVQTNISPLVALADAETGSNLLRGYVQPESGAARRKELLSYADKIQSDRNALNQRLLQAAQAQRQGSTLTDILKSMVESKSGQTFKDPSMARGAQPRDKSMGEQQLLFKFKEAFDKDTKGLSGKLADAGDIFTALQNNSWVGDTLFASKIARLAGAQPLSNFDIQRIKDPALIESIKNAWSKLSSGRLALKSRKEIEAFATVLQDRIARVHGAAFEDYVNKKAPAVGLDKGKAADFIGAGWMMTGYNDFKTWKANRVPPEIKALQLKLREGKATPEEVQKAKDFLQKRGAE